MNRHGDQGLSPFMSGCRASPCYSGQRSHGPCYATHDFGVHGKRISQQQFLLLY